MKQNLLFKLSYLMSNFALTLGYLNLALNDPTLICDLFITENLTGWQGLTRLRKQTDILGPFIRGKIRRALHKMIYTSMSYLR